MRPLELGDRCYKFFPLTPQKAKGSGSIAYEPNRIYSDKKLFFFRRNEAVESLKNLSYFMGYGDAVVEIVVDQELINGSVYSSPNHFVTQRFIIGQVHDMNSLVVQSLLLDALRGCSDFSKTAFIDVVQMTIEGGGFDNALLIYDTIVEEKALRLSRDDDLRIMDFSSRSWRHRISLSDVRLCENMQRFICLLKEIAE